MKTALTIRYETDSDHAPIRKLHIAAFGTTDEADLVDRLRANGDVVISLVAESGGNLLGHLLFTKLTLITAEGNLTSLALAPLSVQPDQQRTGIGTALMNRGLEACRESSHESIFVLGHPDYYSRFGFSSDLASKWESPFGGGPAWMALELQPGSLSGLEGRVEYATPFQEMT